MKYFADLVHQSLSRAKESTLSVLGITNPELRQHLQTQMEGECGKDGSFLASPLFEHTFGWTSASSNMTQLVEKNLISQKVLASLDKNTIINYEGKPVENRYQFKAEYYPYTHQLRSWKTLLADDVKSVVVTSGTGSGKTECFMVPVLEDLSRELKIKKERLSGVRAIFLYPLNALINSQRERLHAWTQDFGSDMRFCLYNGNTVENENKVRGKQKLVPNEILSREMMRKEPAPILVTNGTMLEYMLVRNIDAPIINKSREEKSLRWIILDEAHTYVGSQAAELSMQLRRVLQAFGVEASNVRFVATSATIADKDAETQLQNFLAELAGVPPSQVVVIDGKRAIPDIIFEPDTPISYQELSDIPAEIPAKKKDYDPDVSSARFNALSKSAIAKSIRDKFVSAEKPIKLTDLVDYLNATFPNQKFDQQQTLQWIDLLTGTKKDKNSQAFLKVRAHFFQRMINGLWSCIDPNCVAKKSTSLGDLWPFGNVYVSQKSRCDCGAPVCEVGFCNDCNEPHLLAVEKNGIIAHRDTSISDEFSLLLDGDNEDDDEETPKSSTRKHYSNPITLMAKPDQEGEYIEVGIEKDSGAIGSLTPDFNLYLLQDSEKICGNCAYTGFSGGKPIRRAMLGSPFYVANVVPTLLEFCPDPAIDKETKLGPNSLPGRGRKLITFTDSRQGTARMAVRMQQEAEKNKLRGLVFNILLDRQKSSGAQSDFNSTEVLEKIKKLRKQIDEISPLAKSSEIFSEMLQDTQRQLNNLEGANGSIEFVSIGWQDMVESLMDKEDINQHILKYNKYANKEVFGTDSGKRKVADMLLTREFIRRPKIYHNLETQGLVKVCYPDLLRITELPDFWEAHNLSIVDWRDFLKVALDFFIRDNSFFKLDDDWRQWIGFRFSHKFLISAHSEDVNDARTKKWALVNKKTANRLGKLLCLGANLNFDNESHVQTINSWLDKAWEHLTSSRYSLLSSDNGKFYLDRRNLHFSFFDKGFVCASTNKILDTTFKGFTPYLPHKINVDEKERYRCQEIDVPEIWELPDQIGEFNKDLKNIRDFINTNDDVDILRKQNLWTDINDRAVEGGFYYRTAEHSAQQSSRRLQNYEDEFKEGKVNVLNCSTTMEMGVDIGGISAVVMNNVPPHPANYLQRAGRAGRSNESRAIAYTLCKNNPHDNEVFNDTSWPFVTKIPAPQVSLESSRLVSRHVNSLLLSIFLREQIGATQKEKTKLNLQWFYESEGEQVSVCDKFKSWMDSSIENLERPIKSLVRATALSSNEVQSVINDSKIAIEQLQESWLFHLEELKLSKESAQKDSPYEYRINLELIRHREEYLLKELAAKAYLPGYGFPTDVVTLNNSNIVDFRREKAGAKAKDKSREDNISLLRDMPSRNLAVAIREYAPGAQLVIDGRVFRSAGISINWQKLGANLKEAQKFDVAWQCTHCGQTGLKGSSSKNSEVTCSRCQNKLDPNHTKKVIQPTGFMTDFFDNPGNDISSQKYIPVQPAWISLQGNEYSLPNPLIGFMSYGHNATIFQHSSGENGTGYAVCLSCGKSESMTSEREFPSNLTPNSTHRPILSTPKSKDSDGSQPPCEGSETVHSEIHIGCTSLTDAFELTLKHPVTGQYIDTTDNGETVALTLAVALRNALATKLGISTSEIGYAIRPSKILESNLSAMVIQLFDGVSGGAGFSTSAAKYIDKLLISVISSLNCDTHCEDACSTCLLDSNTRHDANHLNRNIAKEWLGDDFAKFVSLPAEYNYLAGSEYCHESVKEVIAHQINKGADEINVWLSDDLNEWDLNSRQVHMFVYQMLHINNINLTFVVPNVTLGESEKLGLLRYKELGVVLKETTNALQSGHIVSQIKNGAAICTIASESKVLLSPNESWLVNDRDDILVKSHAEKAFELTNLKTDSWQNFDKSNGTKVEFSTELNGQIKSFGKSFWSLVGSQLESLENDLQSSSVANIEYTDRYLQSPWYLVLLGEIISGLPVTNDTSLAIETLFLDKPGNGSLINHDWSSIEDMIEVFNLWFEKGVKVSAYLDVHEEKASISHRRELLLSFKNGNKYSIGFDQGVGYWNHDLGWNKHYFDFKDINTQLSQLLTAWKNGRVKNGFEWKTVLYVNKV